MYSYRCYCNRNNQVNKFNSIESFFYACTMPITSKRGFKLDMIAQTIGKKRARKITIDATPSNISAGASVAALNSAPMDVNFCFASTEPNVDQPSSSHANNRYRNIKSDEVDAWRAIEAELVAIRMEIDIPYTFGCSVCGVSTSTPIRCLDCGPFALYCKTCEITVHEKVFHKPDIWEVSTY